LRKRIGLIEVWQDHDHVASLGATSSPLTRQDWGHMTKARLIVLIAILMAMTALAAGQNYPNHLIRFIHGFPPGGDRWKGLPDVPTIEEAGVPGFEVISWSGFAPPRGTPKPIIDRLNAEIQRTLKVPAVADRLAKFGGDVRGATPAEMGELVARQVALWAKVAKKENIQVQ
jgi:tripartite-type tricarboxylate transporter receptor subunit TctC